MMRGEGVEPDSAIWEVSVQSDFWKGIELNKKLRLLKGKRAKIES